MKIHTQKHTRTHIDLREWAHPPAQRRHCVYIDWIIGFSFWNYRIFGICHSVFPRRTLNQPRRRFSAATDQFTHRLKICLFEQANAHTRARTYMFASEQEMCVFDGVTAFSFVIFLLRFVFKFSYHKPLLFLFFSSRICICTFKLFSIVCWLFTRKTNGTKKLSITMENYASCKFIIKEKHLQKQWSEQSQFKWYSLWYLSSVRKQFFVGIQCFCCVWWEWCMFKKKPNVNFLPSAILKSTIHLGECFFSEKKITLLWNSNEIRQIEFVHFE